MTLSQFLSDIYDSLTVAEVQAEAPTEEKPEEKSDESGEKEEKEDEAEEEEEEEEPEDIMPKLQEECENSKKCAPLKHHYDECAERVQQWDDASEDEKPGKRDNCVEEYFHLMHCAGDCVAPKLWAKLK